VPTIKWRALQEIANLLADKRWREAVEHEVAEALSRCLLETETAELLFALFLARRNGYLPSSSIPKSIRARSPLSRMLLREIYDAEVDSGEPSLPVEIAPIAFSPSRSFAQEQGRSVPLIFQKLLQGQEHPSLPPLVTQYAYEWERSASFYPDAPIQRDLYHFFRVPYEEMTGQFVTRSSHRGRSAYLRVLSTLECLFNAPRSFAEGCAEAALPLDPTFASLKPARPRWLPRWDSYDGETEAKVTRFLKDCQSNLRATSPRMQILAFAAPLVVSDNLVLEIEAVRWAQWGNADIDPVQLLNRSIQRRPNGAFARVSSDGLSPRTSCISVPLQDLRDPEIDAVPLASKMLPWRTGYLHADLYSRGLYAPVTTISDGVVVLKPDGDRVVAAIGDKELGALGYWNVNWTATYPRLTKACCGVALLGNEELAKHLLHDQPTRYFTLWQVSSVHRENHSKYVRKDLAGVIAHEDSTFPSA